MEPTFYDESRAAFRGGPENRGMKRPATLDLDGPRASSKKPRGANVQLLTSPDMNMLKLESPELEKLIIQQHGLMSAQGQCMYPNKNDDREQQQQQYPSDFRDTLGGLPSGMHLYQQQQLQSDLIGNGCGILQPSTNVDIPPVSIVDTTYHGGYHHNGHHPQQHQQQPLSTINTNCTNNPMVSSTMGGSNCYTTGGYYSIEPMVSVKEEPQTVPCVGGPSPPQSPIDMEDQERLKLERKRLRNRIAASKCRRRKLERIARLEDKVARLKSENAELTSHVTRLREHVCQLKQQVMDHVRSGCEILVSSYPTYGDEL